GHGVGIGLTVLVNQASDGTVGPHWDILGQLGVGCFDTNPSVPDHPHWYTLAYGDGPHVIRIEATKPDVGYGEPGYLYDSYDVTFTLPHRRPGTPQLSRPAPIS